MDSRGLEPTVEILGGFLVLNHAVTKALNLDRAGDVVLRPQFTPEELEVCEMTIRWDHAIVSTLFTMVLWYGLELETEVHEVFSMTENGEGPI